MPLVGSAASPYTPATQLANSAANPVQRSMPSCSLPGKGKPSKGCTTLTPVQPARLPLPMLLFSFQPTRSLVTCCNPLAL